ncbi:nitrous oxide reductase accessory protein NosL [Nitratiruptor sp. SB155-2]|uniref:nitrous oxide reductase accessory protein NosL n=1 Tax=Nitratiruptor sp. (strain SB155-2) TaxID=387092 RepID=UPI0001587111|nr:nitrous oxide reductase accessory protein NosL [Nitratiruptor sp. SB155-2]BAF70884.1 conserved hypothetical protein [Nitratiruptor sp. SB155-2]
MKRIVVLILFVVALFAEVVKDPVYHIDVNKYPRFQAKIELANEKSVLFCCPKSMFYFYLRPFEFPEYNITKETDFKKLMVKDYISGDWIKAEGATYVFGSRLQGPKGDDLIPVRNKDALNIFRLKYGGTKILTFPEIVHKGIGLIKYLDMP